MEVERYPAHYRDRWGEVTTTIENDGKELRMMVRDVEFTGRSLDDWEPCAGADASALQWFTFNHNELCDCRLEFEMPLQVIVEREQLEGKLHVQLTLGQPASNGGIDREDLILTLSVANRSFRSLGTSRGYFENELLDIHMQLPEGMYMRTCLFCERSDYSPLGSGLFGGLSCFKRAKQALLSRTRSKGVLFALYNQKLDDTVQETYCCPEFKRKIDTSGRPNGQAKA
jgi:hypothetical protein